MEEKEYWLGFSVAPGIGPVKFKELISVFGTAKDAWEAPKPRFAKLMGEKLSHKFDEFRNNFSIENYAKRLFKEGVSFITIKDSEYPQLLKQIHKPPFILYTKGNVEILCGIYPEQSRRTQNDPSSLRSSLQQVSGQAGQANIIAVVGTRRTTQYGREVTRLFTQQLIDQGFTIVSGLAMGVDAIAHQTTIENNGKTIAVLGCGVDCCFPRENTRLYNSIIENGSCIVSELPLSHGPTKGTFPSRNRIIMGLSQGVLVIEGAEDSGALITAEYAFKNKRKVFAVPGPITSGMSKGPYKLIQKGAKLVTKIEDILDELSIPTLSRLRGASKSRIGDTKEEQKILDLLQNEPLQFDDIVRRSKYDSSKLGSLLTIMEMKGFIRTLDNGSFGI